MLFEVYILLAWDEMNKMFLFGSKLLRLNNCRDEDWRSFYFGNSPDSHSEQHSINLDVELERINNFTRKRYIHENPNKALYLYQMSRGFHEKEDDFPIYFNILNYKDIWVEVLQSYVNSITTENTALRTDILPKKFYHLLYQYHMIREDAHWISDEAKVDVQKIHDFEMPSSYFYELRDLINNL